MPTPLPAAIVGHRTRPRGRRSCDDEVMADLELIDCGGGRRLERCGRVIVDRAAPMATEPVRLPPSDWAKPDLRWSKGAWVRGAAHDPWPVSVAGLTLECRPAAGGQVGVFSPHTAPLCWLCAPAAPHPPASGRRA